MDKDMKLMEWEADAIMDRTLQIWVGESTIVIELDFECVEFTRVVMD